MNGDGRQESTSSLAQESPNGGRWREFRDLITSPEQRRIDEIRHRLDNPIIRAEEIGRILPEAISAGSARGDQIARSLQPAIDTALKVSVRKDPKAIAEAIYPALGPAIRKAISSTLMAMIQSLNHMLNQSCSWRGLQWRLEALRTRKSFGEVVLLHTLVYRIEQIFLIHRHSGIVLQHVTADPAIPRDPDLISGMLTAIQDFVHDSFDERTGERLDTLRMDGDHSIWLEQGNHVVMAAVIRGTPPLSLRDEFRKVVDELHAKYGVFLESFNGNVTPIAVIRPELERLLFDKVETGRRRTSPFIWIGLLLLVVGSGYWFWSSLNLQRNWRRYIAQLREEPGIVLHIAESRDDGFFISGMKDPLARDPAEMRSHASLGAVKILEKWEPYYSLDHRLVLAHAHKHLSPPATVQLELQGDLLIVHGSASHPWAKALRRRALSIPGIRDVDSTALLDNDLTKFRALIESIEERTILFDLGKAIPDNQQMSLLEAILLDLRQIQALQSTLGLAMQWAIIGHADPTGSEAFNLKLSRDRAETVHRFLIRNGIHPLLLVPISAGIQGTVKPEPASDTIQSDRRVTFKGRYFLESE